MTFRAERSGMIRPVDQPNSFPGLVHSLAAASLSPEALSKTPPTPRLLPGPVNWLL